MEFDYTCISIPYQRHQYTVGESLNLYPRYKCMQNYSQISQSIPHGSIIELYTQYTGLFCNKLIYYKFRKKKKTERERESWSRRRRKRHYLKTYILEQFFWNITRFIYFSVTQVHRTTLKTDDLLFVQYSDGGAPIW